MGNQILSYVGTYARISVRDYGIDISGRYQVTVYFGGRNPRYRYFGREATAMKFAERQIAAAGPAVPQAGGAPV